MLAQVRWPRPRIHVDIPWRRGGAALRRLLRSAGSFILALASALAVIFRVAAHGTQRVLRVAVPATLRAIGLAARVMWRAVRFAAREVRRAWHATVPLIRAAGRAMRAAGTRSLEAAARGRERRRERAAIRAAALRAAAPPQPVAVTLTAAKDYDPLGGDGEHPELVTQAIDGNLSTGWHKT